MSYRTRLILIAALGALLVTTAAWYQGGPGRGADARDSYFPNTERLGADEIRVISLGTGNPNFRRSQASPSWLVEVGNGDKFLFDVGTGSLGNLSALEIPYDEIDKVFVSHLHIDHIGDLDALFIGGWVSNRLHPLRVWGPSGESPEYGTEYAVERMKEMYRWDVHARRGKMPMGGANVEVTEFDFAKTGVVYTERGVTIRSWPALHGADGAVSYSLEYGGLKLVYSGDNVPNKWFLEEARDADLLIHETYFTVQQLIDFKDYDPERAHFVSNVVHTPPAAVGKLSRLLEPRHAVAFHVFTDFNIVPEVLAAIRTSYDGPLTLAEDLLVWNVTPDEIRVRKIQAPEAVWPAPPPVPAGPPDGELVLPSQWIRDGRVNLLEMGAEP